jgi:hypothetical protein
MRSQPVEASMLVGASIDYYTQLERGKLTGVSDSVLNAVASALQLDEAERATCSTWLARRTPPSRCCAPRPAATPTTRACPAWSASYPAHDALRLLASWAATLDQAESAYATDRA